MLKIENLNYSYKKGLPVLKDISLNVGPGEFVALIGPSGVGKSTLLRCINRLIKPESGSVYICGEDIIKSSGKKSREIRRNIGIIFQQLNLVKRSTVIRNVLIGRLGFLSPWKSCLYRLKYTYSQIDRMLAINNLKKVGMREYAYERVDRLSGGQQQRVAIARLLVQAPDIVLADEPVANLDLKMAREILHILLKMTKEQRIASLVSIHAMELAQEFATRVIALNDGEIIFNGKPHEISEDLITKVFGEVKRGQNISNEQLDSE